MPDSKPPQGYPAPAGPDLLRRAAELVAETPRLVAEAREQVRWSRELRLVAEGIRRRRGRPAPPRRP